MSRETLDGNGSQRDPEIQDLWPASERASSLLKYLLMNEEDWLHPPVKSAVISGPIGEEGNEKDVYLALHAPDTKQGRLVLANLSYWLKTQLAPNYDPQRIVQSEIEPLEGAIEKVRQSTTFLFWDEVTGAGDQ